MIVLPSRWNFVGAVHVEVPEGRRFGRRHDRWPARRIPRQSDFSRIRLRKSLAPLSSALSQSRMRRSDTPGRTVSRRRCRASRSPTPKAWPRATSSKRRISRRTSSRSRCLRGASMSRTWSSSSRISGLKKVPTGSAIGCSPARVKAKPCAFPRTRHHRERRALSHVSAKTGASRRAENINAALNLDGISGGLYSHRHAGGCGRARAVRYWHHGLVCGHRRQEFGYQGCGRQPGAEGQCGGERDIRICCRV